LDNPASTWQNTPQTKQFRYWYIKNGTKLGAAMLQKYKHLFVITPEKFKSPKLQH